MKVKPPQKIWKEAEDAKNGGLVDEINGVVVEWLKPAGAQVEKGDEITKIEVIKTSMTIEAPTSGTLNIKMKEGEEFKPGDTLAEIE